MSTQNLSKELIEQMHWRYAVKKFDAGKKISEFDWKTMEESLILSASSYGLQPWKFIVVQSPELRKKLTPASWNQTQVNDCSHYVVFATKTQMDEGYISKFIELTCRERGIPTEKLEGYKKMMISDLVHGTRSKMISEWAARQAYIALGNFLTTAALLKIDTCPMEGIEPPKYDEILGLGGSGYHTVVACAAGYRSSEDLYAKAKKIRFNRSEVIVTK